LAAGWICPQHDSLGKVRGGACPLADIGRLQPIPTGAPAHIAEPSNRQKADHILAYTLFLTSNIGVNGLAQLANHPDNPDMKIGDALRKRRQERAETLEAVAFRVDSDASNISRIERNRQQPSAELLERLAEALGCSVTDLYAEVSSKKGKPQELPDKETEDSINIQRSLRALSPQNRQLAMEFIKLLARLQNQSQA